ncbi:MAG: hypothetical protein Q8M15_12780 [Bacteroidota bacterium]|nr:hypothetical protein [Bacteroidota bacterium]
MTPSFFKVILFIIPIVWVSCAPTRIVKPLAKGEQTLSFNLGGPLINFAGAPIPVPLSALSYSKGITATTTAFSGLHTTALLFGVFQTDIGICTQLYYNPAKKFGISINPVINFAIDRWEWNAKLWPELDINVYKDLGKKCLLYGGMASWFELSKIRPHREIQQQFIFINPHLGFSISTGKWNYCMETKYLMGGIKNKPNVADYIGINNHGAIGIYLNVSRKF